MKTKIKSVAITATVAALFSTANVAHAGIVVDLFTDPAVGQTATTSTLGGTDSNQVGDYPATILGGYRDISITKLTDTSGLPNSGAASIAVGAGVLDVSNDTGITSRGVITWDGSNAAGAGGSGVNTTGLNANLLAGGANSFLAQVLYADLGFNYQIKIWDMDGSIVTLKAGVQFAVPLGVGDNAYYSYDWFQLASGTYCDGVASPPTCSDPTTQLDFEIVRGGNLGSIDFGHIGAIQLILENDSAHASADFSLGKIETVPEPSSIALVGLGLLGFASLRRRKQQG